MKRAVSLLLSFAIIFVLTACSRFVSTADQEEIQSAAGSSAANLHALCSESVEWADGKRFEGGASKESVENWIGEIEIK